MLLNTFAETKWNSRNKKQYINLGHRFTSMGEPVFISVQDLPEYSLAIINVRCDYCKTVYQTSWSIYLKGKAITQKDCCSNPVCTGKKARESILRKYGHDLWSCPEISKRRNSTNLKRYGANNVFASDEIKNKIVETNMRKYGVAYIQQNDEVRNKTRKTCLKRYGVENYVELFAGKFVGENSPVWKGGVEHHRVERSTREYIVWRTSVFKRDKYMCRKCGVKNGNGTKVELNAHHILNWKDNIEHRYNINNGVTLCADCHNKFHSRFGKNNNTTEQLSIFLLLDEKVC